MNERINQLAKQAEQYADDTMNADPAKYDKPGQVKVWRELMQGKLAELLIEDTVRKCALQIGGTNADKIKQHFGVE